MWFSAAAAWEDCFVGDILCLVPRLAASLHPSALHYSVDFRCSLAAEYVEFAGLGEHSQKQCQYNECHVLVHLLPISTPQPAILRRPAAILDVGAAKHLVHAGIPAAAFESAVRQTAKRQGWTFPTLPFWHFDQSFEIPCFPGLEHEICDIDGY